MPIQLTEKEAARLVRQASVDEAKKEGVRKPRTKGLSTRAKRGEGDRLSALAQLAAAGWTTYQSQAGQHYFKHSDGRTSPVRPTYGAAIDAALAEANA